MQLDFEEIGDTCCFKSNGDTVLDWLSKYSYQMHYIILDACIYVEADIAEQLGTHHSTVMRTM